MRAESPHNTSHRTLILLVVIKVERIRKERGWVATLQSAESTATSNQTLTFPRFSADEGKVFIHIQSDCKSATSTAAIGLVCDVMYLGQMPQMEMRFCIFRFQQRDYKG